MFRRNPTATDFVPSSLSSSPGSLRRGCWTALLIACLAFNSGCAQRYAITLSNSDVVYAKGRPRLNERGFYVFTDIQGREQQVNAIRVRIIEAK